MHSLPSEPFKMPRFAALDVGSNALRLRVIEAASPDDPQARLQLPLLPGEPELPSGWRDIVSLRAPVRLGGEVFSTGKLAPASIGQACAALREFRAAMDEAKVDAYRATATSAVREASNGSTLVERALREAGIELEIIEGVEEARLIQLAVVRQLRLQDKRALLFDVGGGSTELTVLDHAQPVFSMTLPLGTVRLLETFMRSAEARSGKVDKDRAKLMGETIDRTLAEALPHLNKAPFQLVVGTGGNVETLADLCPVKGGLDGYARAIDVATLRPLLAKLSAMTAAERRDTYALRPDRADTIVPAAAILLRLAEGCGKAPGIVAPQVGLKDGILVELVDKYFHVWDSAREAQSVMDACARLGRRYHYDEAHGLLVAKLSSQLFDDLVKVHNFGERERLLLRAAAVLHDIGDFVRYDGHHKHGHYLILHSDIMGLSPEEHAIVANIARYHRKSLPDPSHPNFRELGKDARGKVRALAAILRIADALDREHLGKVEGVRATVDRAKGRVTLAIAGQKERELEEWTVRAKADLLRDVFDLDVVVGNGQGSSDGPVSTALKRGTPATDPPRDPTARAK
jgi:exopolyphosphatase/guanosine-5'-triphosphate,3'-diphosphate pyrophosphatase